MSQAFIQVMHTLNITGANINTNYDCNSQLIARLFLLLEIVVETVVVIDLPRAPKSANCYF